MTLDSILFKHASSMDTSKEAIRCILQFFFDKKGERGLTSRKYLKTQILRIFAAILFRWVKRGLKLLFNSNPVGTLSFHRIKSTLYAD